MSKSEKKGSAAEASNSVPVEPSANPMKICFVASEVAPYAKTGGLADVSAALPAHLGRQGHDVRVFMPLYSKIDFARYDFTPVEFLHHVPLQMGANTFHFSVFVSKLADTETDLYFIGCPQLFDREGVYTGEWDEHLRFSLLSRAALECCQRMGWGPDILHCNDWHTALLPLYLKTIYSWDSLFANTRTVLTIHNMAYQGLFPAEVIDNLGLSAHSGLLHQQDLERGRINFLKCGVLYADVVSTVSETYAQEIQTEAFGEGLEDLLRARSRTVIGIVNGVDYGVWNPATDTYITQNYTIDTVAEGKAANQEALLRDLKLPHNPHVPVIGVVSRLTAQKGFELTFDAMTEALRYLDLRYVVLGSGESSLEDHFHWLQRTFPHKMCFYRGYSEELAHRIEAGADIFLMPSRFEPCGLNQMYSLKYGTVPIVRRTGGLADTVELYDPKAGTGTGFVFDHYDAKGFTWALKAALTTYQDGEAWAAMRQRGMEQDYSWERQGARYEELYRALLG